jgi:hypothetical protein
MIGDTPCHCEKPPVIARSEATKQSPARGHAAATTLRAVMTRKPHAMPPDRTAIEALYRMRDDASRHIPLVEQQVVGSR